MKAFSKLIFTILILITYKNVSAQLDTIHWLPPIHGRLPSYSFENYLYISTPSDTPVQYTIKIPGGQLLDSGVVSNNTPVSYNLGTNLNSPVLIGVTSLNIPIQNKGVVIESSFPCYVNYRCHGSFSSQSRQATITALKGNTALGTEFRIGGIKNLVAVAGTYRSSFFSFMATHDSTIVHIDNIPLGVSFEGNNPPSGTSDTVFLDKGESAVFSLYTSNIPNTDGILGIKVTSNYDISLMNGFFLGNIGTNTNAQDIGADQPVPINELGTRYILVKGDGTNQYEQAIIIAHTNNTQIFLNGALTPITTLNEGDYYLIDGTNFSANGNLLLESNNSFYCYQHLLGGSSAANGDLNFIPPISCGMPNFIDNIPAIDSIGNTSFIGKITIIRRTQDTIRVYSQSGLTTLLPGSGNSVVGNNDWQTHSLSGLTGKLKVESTGSIACCVLGSNLAAGYGAFFSGFGNNLSASFSSIDTLSIGSLGEFVFTGNVPAITSFVWDWDGGMPLHSSIEHEHLVKWNSPGWKNITLTVTNGDCSESYSDSVYIADDPIICAEDSIEILAHPVNTSKLWSTGDTTSTINVSPSTTTKYWVRQIAGTDTIVDTITVNVLNPTINASTNSICNPGDSVMLWTSKDSSVTQSCGGMPASLQNGLMAYYPFCGNANDLSGFGNHGTVLNAALANDRNGNPQSAYYFDGSSKITVPSSAQISDSLNTQVTFSTWINVESYPNSFGPILSKNGPITRQFEVWVGPNKLGFWSTQIYGSATTTVPYNTWLHYVVTFDQGTVKYYLNSTLIQTSSYTTTSLAGNNSVFEIGHDSPGVLELFKGYIDDVAIWNRVLSPADVANLYNHSTNYSNTLWSTGETTDTIWINPNSDTTIWVSSTLGNVTCVDSINIDFLSPEIHSNTLGVCAPGDTAILWVENESHSVTWSTGETSDTIFVTPVAATSYWVQFTSFNGVCSDTVEIDVSEPIEIFGDSLLCKGDSVLLYVDGSSFFSLSDTLYFNNFENTIGNEFSTTATTTFSGSSLLGNFGNQTITLSLSSLPLDSIRFSFDLWIHDSWDGNSTGVNGTDSLSIHWNQFSLLHTTFNNHTGGTQSYPNNYPASNPSKTGSILSTSSLCSGQGSSKYHLSFDTNNNSANGVFSFDGTPSQSLCDESWSIDNVLIEALNGVATSSVMWSTGESSDSIWVKPTQTTTYWVSSTDQYGCESTDSITVLVSDIQSTISVEEPSCNGSSDGQAQINPTGGITPYTFLWGNGSGSSMANNLSSDTVWVAVTDSIGCSAVDTFYIDQPDSLIISNIQTSNYNGFNVSCNGGSDGSVSTTVIGGTMPYYYNWNNNTYTTSSISNVGAGTYVLQVTDTNGCAVNETIVLAEPNPIIISPSITSNYNGYAISCYGESDGSADVTIAGGIAPYSILWSNGVPTSSITNVSSGSYSVIITDDNGCVDSAQINLNQPNPLTGTAVVTDASCYGNADGSLDLTLSGGAGSYFIAWSTGDSSLSVYNLPSGWYTYSVISSNNCEIADSVYINQPTPLTIELDTVHPTCINSFDGELNVVAMGGTPGYNYFLNGNAFTGSIQGLGTDSLRILAVDFNNCDTLFVIAMPPVRDPCIFIPNWFSPNGNSKEDLWLIEGFEYGQLKLRIFNVYGQQIYYTESQNYVPWDGTYNGKELPNGDYYYVIESENYFSQYTGYVTILR